jgi:sugar/nucleoside kinase (ribokinase family)
MNFDAAIFGLLVADIVASPLDLRNPPPPGGLAVLKTLELTTGGNACNVAAAMAKLGMRAAAAGLVGEDVLGEAVIERLKSFGVDTSAIFKTDRAQTSATVVAVEPGGERCFFHTPGATALLDANAFRRCFDLFTRCAFVQIGYFGLLPALTNDLPNVIAELKRSAPNTKVTLDTVNPPGEWKLLEPILPHLDIFAPSRPEAAALLGETEPTKIVAKLRKHMPRALLGVKLDIDGCFLDDGQTSVLAPAYKIEVVDTTGAGDTWFGGLLTALRKNMPLAQAAKLANRAAADCCTAFGASAGVRSFDQTLARV